MAALAGVGIEVPDDEVDELEHDYNAFTKRLRVLAEGIGGSGSL